MKEILNEKIETLEEILIELERIVVAFSGGVDSSFLLKIGTNTLGNNCIAVILKTPVHSQLELDQAKKIADSFDVPLEIISIDITLLDDFKENSSERCYFCKKYMFSKITEFANEQNISHVIEGSNIDDLTDYRPGLEALKELKILSPLVQAGFTKEDIRTASNRYGLKTWDKPANPCLATRIPYGIKISKDILSKIEKAEEYLQSIGLIKYRVRYHDSIARIEANKEDVKILLTKSEEIVQNFKNIGFHYITLDLEGYRMGSLNEVL